jgi:hypothetical protein
MNRLTVAVLLLSFSALPAFSQRADTAMAVMINDTVFKLANGDYMVADTLQVTPMKPKSPSKALMFALVLPGLGQAYNGKYYKIPIVWGALGVAGYAIVFNTNQYRDATLNYMLDESSTNKRYLDGWKRRMELSYIGAIVVYGLQILDAYVDANLSTWDVSENLSLGISPSLQPMMAPSSKTGYSGGLTCSLKIRSR